MLYCYALDNEISFIYVLFVKYSELPYKSFQASVCILEIGYRREKRQYAFLLLELFYY